MSNTAFDFLAQSFLFDDIYIEENFRTVSEQELCLELGRYREHIQKNYLNIIDEVQSNKGLNATIESFGDLPNEQLLKQLALYMDIVVISDPIFKFTLMPNEIDIPMSKLMGIENNNKIDRINLAKNAKYMKKTTPLVAARFVKYVPISLIHEPPKKLPILYSSDNFSSELSEDLYKFFIKNAKVNNILMEKGKMFFKQNDDLVPGTTIVINFDSEGIRKGHIYQYMINSVTDIDKKTGKFKFIQHIPDSINDIEFKNWVRGSINRAAVSEFTSTLNEATLAKKLNCMYMAKSQFTSDLLSQTIVKNSVTSDLANLSMKLELPVLNEISLEHLVNIRMDNGEAFYNFREELNSKLLSLRGINNKDELERKIENISYEMNETNVYEVKKEYRKIVKSLGLDALLLTGTLIAGYYTGGLTLIGAAAALAKGGIDYTQKYLNGVRENNGYFLWKLKR